MGQNVSLFTGRLIDSCLAFIREKYTHVEIDTVLTAAQIELRQLADKNHLFSLDQVTVFLAHLKKVTGDPDLLKGVGQYMASDIGMLHRLFCGMVAPVSVFKYFGKYSKRFDPFGYYTFRRFAKNQLEITYRSRGNKDQDFQCEMRQGYWDTVAKLFNYRLPQTYHSECTAAGDEYCRYIVSWQKTKSILFKRIRNISCIAALFTFPFLFFFSAAVTTLLFSSAMLFLFITATGWLTKYYEAQELTAAVEDLRDASGRTIDELNENYHSTKLINEIGQAIAKDHNIDNVLDNIVLNLQKFLDYDRGLILLVNRERNRLLFRTGYGYSGSQLELLQKIQFRLDHQASKGVFVIAFKNQEPFLLSDINDISDSISPRSFEFARKMGVKSFICCPIIYENESLGILAVDNIHTKRPLSQKDVNVLMSIVPQIGINLYNAVLTDGKLRQFQSILQVLAVTNDARDPITAKHSEKVTGYAVGICDQLGLDHEYTEMIRVASLLHDYGKVGITDAILKKPGRLNKEERKIVETHVEKTQEVLEKIHFEGMYQEVPNIACAHHEKVDGTGYPLGLKGDEIPLGAKIIAAADVFEAITSKRHYRDPMPLNLAFIFMRMEIGTHFDKVCVEALIRYIKAEDRFKDIDTDYVPGSENMRKPFPFFDDGKIIYFDSAKNQQT